MSNIYKYNSEITRMYFEFFKRKSFDFLWIVLKDYINNPKRSVTTHIGSDFYCPGVMYDPFTVYNFIKKYKQKE